MKRVLCASIVAALAFGCATALETDPIPSDFRGGSRVYFVENHGKDERRMDEMIAARLQYWGLRATSGYASDRPAKIDVLVVYEDRWQWDMSMYLIDLKIDMRDPVSGRPIASGHSYQTSLARKSPEVVVAQVVDGMMGETPQSK